MARESQAKTSVHPIKKGQAKRGKAALESWGQKQTLCGARESSKNECSSNQKRPSEARQSGPRILGAKLNKAARKKKLLSQKLTLYCQIGH